MPLFFGRKSTMVYTLIGMPGSGKSCMSRAVGKTLNVKALDSDRLIENRAGKKLHEIIKESGVDGLKKIEEEVLLTIDSEDDLILATGGSAVYYERAMEHFKSVGRVIYLYVSYETMIERIGDYSKRGIAIRPDQTIRDLYNERSALYEKYADVTVNCDGNDYYTYRKNVIKAIKGV